MKKIILLFFLSLFFINCSKEKDDKLNLFQQDFNGNQLRLDGFYYKEFENTNGGISFDRFALYQNGIIRYLGAASLLSNDNFIMEITKDIGVYLR